MQRAIKTPQARWIDSIACHAMLGEALYHQGRNAEALAEFDQACQLVLAYPDWLLSVRFQQPPAPDANRARRTPPWGSSDRQFTLGQLPAAESVLVGRLDAGSRALKEGGVVSMAQFWRVNVAEIVRTSALAIRRRNELLGPLAEHDAISKELSAVLSRGNLSPPNHWSKAWVELELGLALAGMGRADEAKTHLEKAVLLDGRYDHPLTCVALLEQGRLAMAGGDYRDAAQLFGEAGISAFYYDDLDVIAEALWLGWVNHMASGQGTYPPLPIAVDWAEAGGWRQIAVRLQLAQAETLLGSGHVPQAAALLEQAARRLGDMRGGLLGIHQQYLEALVYFQQGHTAAGEQVLAKAIVAQATASLRNFQLGRANALYDTRGISSRTAAELYEQLLADPTSAEWTTWPLDAIAVLKTPHEEAFDRWLAATLERNDVPAAVEISERAKRRRFLASLPLGGRLVALRAIAEAPQAELTHEQLLERQALLAAFPGYRQLDEAGRKLEQELLAGPILAQDDDDRQAIARRFDDWSNNSQQREQVLLVMALRRLPSSLGFPPIRTTAELQQALGDGQALAIFHVAGDNLLGFLVSRTDTHVWRIPDARRLRTPVAAFLRDLGNYGAARSVSLQELRKDAWRESGAKLFSQVFGESRLDLAKTKSLVIVPDGWLWYVPFDALVTPGPRSPNLLADRVLVHYGPLAALAVGDRRPLRRPRHSGIAANDLAWLDSDSSREEALKQLDQAVTGPVRLTSPLPEPGFLVAPLLDVLVNLDEIDVPSDAPYDWSPLPAGTVAKGRSRGGSGDTLLSWFALPYGGPEQVVLAALKTAAADGLKGSSRRGAHQAAPGSEVFQVACGLMASGARTVLVSRWPTGGQTNFDLVREFIQELPHASAAEAWRRSVLLARETPLELAREPRIKKSDDGGEPLTADHPFLWSGYLLFDAGGGMSQEQPVNLPPPVSGAEPAATTRGQASPSP